MWYSAPCSSWNSASSSDSDVRQRGHQWMTRWPRYTRPRSYRLTNASRTARDSVRRERVRRALPVARCAEGAQLLQDDAPGLARRIAIVRSTNASRPRSKRVLPFGDQQLLDDVLRRDAGVIGARHPQCLVAGHAPPADDHVLHGVVEAVPHVENRRDVRRRNDHHERRLRAANAVAVRRPGRDGSPAASHASYNARSVAPGSYRSGSECSVLRCGHAES